MQLFFSPFSSFCIRHIRVAGDDLLLCHPSNHPSDVNLHYQHPRRNKSSRRRCDLLPHRRGSPLADLVTLGLLLVDTGGQDLGVVVALRMLVWDILKEKGEDIRSLAGSLSAAALDGNAVTLALQALGSNQTLDLGGLGVLGLALPGDGAADDKLADIVLLVEAEETADLGGTLGTQALGDDGVGQAGELVLTLLDDAQSQNSEVETGDGWRDCQ